MYVRLAFAVAAHLEPEILIVDEVLAVGDAEFQKKCLGKMGTLAEEGRTVLFVSHNMPAVNRLCTRALLLDCGAAVEDGPVGHVTGRYLQSSLARQAEKRWLEGDSAPQSSAVRLVSVRVRDRQGQTRDRVDIREEVGVEIEYDVKEAAILTPSIHVYDSQDAYAFVANDSYNPEWGDSARRVGRWKSTCWIPGNLLGEGEYVVDVTFKTAGDGPQTFRRKAGRLTVCLRGPGRPYCTGSVRRRDSWRSAATSRMDKRVPSMKTILLAGCLAAPSDRRPNALVPCGMQGQEYRVAQPRCHGC